MAKLTKYDLSGKELEQVEVNDSLLLDSANSQMIKDYIVALRENARQWSANTKGRTEVNRCKTKPHPQKGTGRARQGSRAAAQYRGGGVVFGPKPKFDQHVRINKKERRKAIGFLISEKIKEGKVKLVKTEGLDSPKTKTASTFLKTLGIEGSRVLLLGQTFSSEQGKETAEFKQGNQLVLSMRNLQKVSFLPLSNISGYDLLISKELVIMEDALDELLTLLGRAS